MYFFIVCLALAEALSDAESMCSVYEQIDFDGNDILPPYPPSTDTPQDCCIKCTKQQGCKAFSYATDSGTCYLKKAVRRKNRPGRISALVNSSCTCTPPPGPP